MYWDGQRVAAQATLVLSYAFRWWYNAGGFLDSKDLLKCGEG